MGAQVLPQATATDTPADAVVDLAGIPARYVGFDIRSNHGSTFRVGIAEMQFTVVPEPSTLLLGVLGLLALATGRRRSR